MMLGNIQRFEVVVGRFDFGSRDHAETDCGEDAQKFVVGLADQVTRANSALDAGEGELNFVASRSGLFRRRFFSAVSAAIRSSM